MVHDDRGGRLLRNDLVRLRQRDADARTGVEQPEGNLVLREVGTRTVTPRVAFTALRRQTQLGTDPPMRVFGKRLGRLHREAVQEVRFAVVAGGLERFGALRRLRTDGD